MEISQAPNGESNGSSASATVIRMLGVLVLLSGLFSGAQVVFKAWDLIENQATIVQLGEKIDQQSQINSFVAQMDILVEFINSARRALPQVAAPSSVASHAAAGAASSQTANAPFNAAYFTAWTVMIVLLGLIAKISSWAIVVGGKLALHSFDQDHQLRLVLGQLIQEVRRR